jgi:hypothetical protein
MRTLDRKRPAPNRVVAEFASSALSFVLPPKATFQDLAFRLAALGAPHRGAPLSVEVRLGG